MRRVAAVTATAVAIGAAAATAFAAEGSTQAPAAIVTSLAPSPAAVTTLVGPPVAGSETAPAATATGAGQLVSGVTESTVGVAVQGSRASYIGTEPSAMTVERTGETLIVTIAPR